MRPYFYPNEKSLYLRNRFHKVLASNQLLTQLRHHSLSSVARSCLTLCDPMECSMPASLSITNTQSLLKLMSIESVMPSSHLILCCPLLLLPSIFPNIRIFSNKSVLHIRWPKYWSFSFNISPFNEYSGLISFYVVHAKSLAQGQVSK